RATEGLQEASGRHVLVRTTESLVQALRRRCQDFRYFSESPRGRVVFTLWSPREVGRSANDSEDWAGGCVSKFVDPAEQSDLQQDLCKIDWLLNDLEELHLASFFGRFSFSKGTVSSFCALTCVGGRSAKKVLESCCTSFVYVISVLRRHVSPESRHG
ncbi:unnamed protein product, partial [Nesidiocoris tenuis]